MAISKTRKAYCIVYQGSKRCTPSHVFLTDELRMMAATTTSTTIGPTIEKLTQPSHKARLSLCRRRTNVPCLHKLISTKKKNQPTNHHHHLQPLTNKSINHKISLLNKIKLLNKSQRHFIEHIQGKGRVGRTVNTRLRYVVDTRRSHEDRTLCIEFLGKVKGWKGRRRGREREKVTAWRERKRGGENVIDIVNSGWKVEKGKEGISERERKEFYRGREILGLERN